MKPTVYYCYVSMGAPLVFQQGTHIYTDINTLPIHFFLQKEIINEDEDGVLKVKKSYYPDDGRHFMYVNKKYISRKEMVYGMMVYSMMDEYEGL